MITLSDYDVITPRTLDEALDAMASSRNIRPFAGGTDLMVQLESGSLTPCTFLNLEGIRELQPQQNWDTAAPMLPALTTYRDVRNGLIGKRFPLLAASARCIGALAIQSRGTWAGNVANASPAADGVPALMVYDAELELRSKSGIRKVPLSTFYRGYKQMDLQAGEMIFGIQLPQPEAGFIEYFRKVGTRRFQAISKTLLAARIRLSDDRRIDDIRLAFASVAPYTLRALQTERILKGRHLTRVLVDEACAAIQDEIHPIDDLRSTETYRRRVTSNLLREFLTSSQHP